MLPIYTSFSTVDYDNTWLLLAGLKSLKFISSECLCSKQLATVSLPESGRSSRHGHATDGVTLQDWDEEEEEVNILQDEGCCFSIETYTVFSL